MSDEQIDQNDGQEDVKDQAPTSQGQADTAVTADSENAATESHEDIRDQLVKELMQSPVDEQHEESKPDEKTDESEDDDEEDDESSEASKDETPKAEDGKDLESEPNLGERTKRTIRTLRQKAAFGDLITQTLVDADIKPEEFSRWTNLAARLKKGDKSAVGELIATAKAFGYSEPATAPKQETSKNVDDVAEEIYKAEFAQSVENLDISEPLARKQARKLAELQRPVTRTEPTQEVKQPVENQQPSDPIREHALKTLAREEQQIREKVKDYDKIAKTVTERLVKEYGTADPIYWVEGYKSIVRDEVRKLTPAPAPKQAIKPVAGTQIRPTQVAAPAKAATNDPREAIAKSILTGKFD